MPPGKSSMSLHYGISMLKVSNKNTRKKCEVCPGGNYLKKNVWGRIVWVEISVGRHLYISSPGTKWKGFGAIVIEEVRPRGREDIPDPCTERATRCKKYTFNCKYRIDLANLVAIPYLKLCWTHLVDTAVFQS